MGENSAGACIIPIGKHPSIVPGEFCDFHGVNYYTRSTVSGPADGVAENCPVNDLGWEIYPEGIGEVCRKAAREILETAQRQTENMYMAQEEADEARETEDTQGSI